MQSMGLPLPNLLPLLPNRIKKLIIRRVYIKQNLRISTRVAYLRGTCLDWSSVSSSAARI